MDIRGNTMAWRSLLVLDTSKAFIRSALLAGLWIAMGATASAATYHWIGEGVDINARSWADDGNWSSSPLFNNEAQLRWNSSIEDVFSYLDGANGDTRVARSLTFGNDFDIGDGNENYSIRLRSGPNAGDVTLSLRAAPSITVEQNVGMDKDLNTLFIGNNVGTFDFRNANLEVNQNSTHVLLRFNAAITTAGDGGGINKNGAGTMELYRAGSFGNGVNIHAGTVAVWNRADAAGTGTITLGALNGAAAATLAAGGTNIGGQTFANNITVHAGDGTRTIRNYESGLVPTLNGNIALGKDVLFDVANHGETQNVLLVGGVISGEGGVLKTGDGILTLSGTNTYSGATRVEAGLLAIEGDHSAATGTVTVANGAVLRGGGTLGGSLFFDYGASFRFDTNTTLTVNGNAVGLGNLGVADLVGLDDSMDAGTYLIIDGPASFDFCSVRNLGAAHAHGLGGGKLAYFQNDVGLRLVVLPPARLDARLLPDGSNLLLEWWGEEGVHYGVESTDDLVHGKWDEVASSHVGGGEWLGFTESLSRAQSYYRTSLKTAAPERRLQRWYEDNNLGVNRGVPPDFASRHDDEHASSWEESLKVMDGFGIAQSAYNEHLKENDVLSTRIGEVLGAYGIPVCINAIAATGAHHYGYDLDYPTTRNMLTRFRNWGWDVRSIALQSVLSRPLGGSYSMSDRVADVVSFFQAIRPLQPHIKIGIIDAIPAKGRVSGPDGYQAAYQLLKDRLADAGYALDFIMMDYPIDFALTGMVESHNGFQHTFEAMVEVERYIEQVVGCPAILILTSRRGGHESADLWRSDVLEGLEGYLAAGGSPDHVYLNAWYPEPVWSAPDEPDPLSNPNGATMLGTFRLVDEILRAHEAENR